MGELLAVQLNDSLRGEPEADAVSLATQLRRRWQQQAAGFVSSAK